VAWCAQGQRRREHGAGVERSGASADRFRNFFLDRYAEAYRREWTIFVEILDGRAGQCRLRGRVSRHWPAPKPQRPRWRAEARRPSREPRSRPFAAGATLRPGFRRPVPGWAMCRIRSRSGLHCANHWSRTCAHLRFS
jgi:hypothetical protein